MKNIKEFSTYVDNHDIEDYINEHNKISIPLSIRDKGILYTMIHIFFICKIDRMGYVSYSLQELFEFINTKYDSKTNIYKEVIKTTNEYLTEYYKSDDQLLTVKNKTKLQKVYINKNIFYNKTPTLVSYKMFYVDSYMRIKERKGYLHKLNEKYNDDSVSMNTLLDIYLYYVFNKKFEYAEYEYVPDGYITTYSKIAKATGYSRKTISNAFTILEDLNIIRLSQREIGKTGTGSYYTAPLFICDYTRNWESRMDKGCANIEKYFKTE